MFEANNLRALVTAISLERAGLDPGGSTEDLVMDAALRAAEELAGAIASDLEAAVAELSPQ